MNKEEIKKLKEAKLKEMGKLIKKGKKDNK